jgi:hypothetical protein
MHFVHFHSNVTVLLHNNGFVAVTEQCKRKHYYGYGGVVYKGEISSELGSWVLGSEERGRTSCVKRTSRVRTCVIELLTVIKSCVLNFECNKVPLWNRTCEFVTTGVRSGIRDGSRKHCSSLSDISTSFETRVTAKRSDVEDQLERSISAVR